MKKSSSSSPSSSSSSSIIHLDSFELDFAHALIAEYLNDFSLSLHRLMETSSYFLSTYSQWDYWIRLHNKQGSARTSRLASMLRRREGLQFLTVYDCAILSEVALAISQGCCVGLFDLSLHTKRLTPATEKEMDLLAAAIESKALPFLVELRLPGNGINDVL